VEAEGHPPAVGVLEPTTTQQKGDKEMQKLELFATGVAIAVAMSGAATASTITIGASRDATIFENNVNNSNGGGPVLFAGTNGATSPRRGLIDFDIAGNIPIGATITGVQLTLHLGQVAGSGGGGGGDQTPRTIGLFELMADWAEGTTGSGSTIGGSGQGFAANPGDTTWSARSFPGTLWATPGGDHAATSSATSTVTSVIDAPYTWASPGLVSNVQDWLNAPATNFGWELINLNEATATDFRAFYSREFSDASLRPSLQITYTAPATVPEPASMMLLGIGGLILGAVGRKRSRKMLEKVERS
jgi:PEP-CTERM motif